MCPSGCRPLHKHGIKLEETTCPCGIGYFEENGTWISGDRIRHKQARTREEYYASRGQVSPTITRSQHSQPCLCCTASPISAGEHKEQSKHSAHSPSSNPYAQSLRNAPHADLSPSLPGYNQQSMGPSSYSSMPLPYSSSSAKTQLSYTSPPTGSASSSSTHGSAILSGSGSSSASDYSTSSTHRYSSSSTMPRTVSSSQSMSSSAERDRPTEPRRGAEKENDRSVATVPEPGHYWKWSSEHREYYHAEQDPNGDTRNTIIFSLD